MSETTQALEVRPDDLLRAIGPFHDIPLQVAVDVGRLLLRVSDLMKLAPGRVIELKKPIGAPFDICVNGMQVARGEVIVVDQSAGVRIIEVHKPGGFR